MKKPTLKHLIFLAATFCAVALCVVSCSKKPQQAIVGKWNVQGKDMVVEFRKDGTMISSQKGVDTIDKYLFLDDTHVQLDMNATAGNDMIKVRVTADVVVQGDNASITIAVPVRAGMPAVLQTVHYTRIK